MKIGAEAKKGSVLTLSVDFLTRRFLKNNLFTLAKIPRRNQIIEEFGWAGTFKDHQVPPLVSQADTPKPRPAVC